MMNIAVHRVYLDVCCLNRPFDDQSQERIRLESEAVVLILKRFETGSVQWISSEVIDFEIEQIPDPERKRRVQLLISHAHHTIQLESLDIARGQELEARGFSTYDALHLACAERAGVDVFLTTDDRLVKRALRSSEQLSIQVANPLVWLAEDIAT